MNFNMEKIQNKFKEIMDKALEDCKFEKGNISNSFDNTNKIMNWLKYRQDFLLLYRNLDYQRKKKYKELYEYYRLEYQIKFTTKDEYTLYIETDINYIDIYNKYITVKEIIQFIDSTIDNLKNRAREITNYIKYLQWSQGG